ncbi:MAG: ribonuclease P protein component [Saccharofermentans sp.]|nr:ribonuclease P protein component [Saccharofermentans sp.]
MRFNYEFSRVYRRGTYANGRHITVHVFRRPKRLKHNNSLVPADIIRVGFCANKKQLGAVGRNHARRLMREAYRRLEPGLSPGADIVITLRSAEVMPVYSDISSEMVRLMDKLGIYKQEKSGGGQVLD